MISTQALVVYKAKKLLFGEIAELGVKQFERVYPDACDLGMVLVSHKTGKATTWVIDEVRFDSDGSILEWHLIPTNDTMRFNPELIGWTLHIAND